MNLETFQTISFGQGCPSCTAFVPVGMHNKHVCYLYRVGDELRMATVDLKGQLVKTKAVPFFSPAYGASPDYALRPDEGAFAYYKDSSHDVCLFDFGTQSEAVLVPDVAKNQFMFAGLMWMDNRYLVAVVNKSNPTDWNAGGVLKIDTQARQVDGRLELPFIGDASISPSGQLLAVTHFLSKGLTIVDLQRMSVAASPTNHTKYFHNPAWHPDETRMAYVDGENWLCMLTLRDRSVQRVAKLPDRYNCYFLGFSSDELCVYRGGPGDGSSRICFLNPRSGKTIKAMGGGCGTGQLRQLLGDGKFLVY
jgi:hypothetical protein